MTTVGDRPPATPYLSAEELILARRLRRSLGRFVDVPTATAVLLPDTRFLFVNLALRRLLGRSQDDIVGRRAIDMLLGRERGLAERIRPEYVSTQAGPSHNRWSIARPDGSVTAVQITTIVVRKPGGDAWYLVSRVLPVGASMAVPISRVVMETSDRRLLREVRAATPDFEDSSTLMLISHVDGRIVAANRSISALLDYRPSSLPGKNLAAVIPDEGQDPGAIRRARLERRGMLAAETRELRNRAGGRVAARLAPLLFRDEQGRARFVLLTGHSLNAAEIDGAAPAPG